MGFNSAFKGLIGKYLKKIAAGVTGYTHNITEH